MQIQDANTALTKMKPIESDQPLVVTGFITLKTQVLLMQPSWK